MSCCGRKNNGGLKNKERQQQLAYDSKARPKGGNCPLCPTKIQKQKRWDGGVRITVSVCPQGHISRSP